MCKIRAKSLKLKKIDPKVKIKSESRKELMLFFMLLQHKEQKNMLKYQNIERGA